MPIIVVPSTENGMALEEFVTEAMDGIDGILLQGGSDILPELYGEEITFTKDPLLYRDHYERTLVKEGIAKGIPIFGVCRGSQLINVALGGTLHQHLPYERWIKHWEEQGIDATLYHEVELVPDGVLHRVTGKESLKVNSYHHQGIDNLGGGLRVEARTSDGLIEGFSWEERHILGVQWHPEGDFSRVDYAAPLEFWLNEWVRG